MPITIPAPVTAADSGVALWQHGESLTAGEIAAESVGCRLLGGNELGAEAVHLSATFARSLHVTARLTRADLIRLARLANILPAELRG